MLAAALAFVLVPLLRRRPRVAGKGDAGDAARRLRALDEALAAGVLEADEYARKRAALDGGAALDGAATAPASRPRSAFVALLLVALLLPASALLLYRLVGAPAALDGANRQPAAGADAAPQMEQAIAALATRLEQHPDDVEGWALLGRAYQATGRSDEALAAFRRAHEEAPDNPAVTIEYAQALAMSRPDRRIEGESRQLLEGVLAADPANQRALWLLGIADYQVRQYDAAIARWNTLLPLLEPGSTVLSSVKAQIAEAEALRDGKAPPAAAAAAPSNATASSGAEAPAAAPDSSPAPRLTVSVTLDPALAARVDPGDTLFVFARAASGPPMPLSIERLTAAALPVTVTLDDSKGMLPSMKLSMFPQVVVGARVSKSGDAMPQPGDIEALSPPLDVHRTEPVALTLGTTVPARP
jgi:cytochrome c-type biogenesis protein CcmH